MRQIIYDTETTGLRPQDGHRIIEIALLERIDGKLTGKKFHTFLNPERECDPEASRVHGLTWADLRDKPRFKDIAPQLVEFMRGAEMIAHNSPFDESHIQAEFERVSHPETVWEVARRFVDTLKLAKQIIPKKETKNYKLDTLLDYYSLDRSMRDKHDALLDCVLLEKMYTKLTEGLDLSGPTLEDDVPRSPIVFLQRPTNDTLVVVQVTSAEVQAHQTYLEEMGKKGKVAPAVAREAEEMAAGGSDTRRAAPKF